jgi:hypothetical protein
VKEVASEYFLGHKIDVDGYNKSPEMDPEAFRQEYLKVAPMLDVFSNSGGEAERKLQSQEAAIKALTTELTTVQERLKQAEESQKVREPSDELMSRLIEDPEVQRVLRRKLKQLGLT